MNETTQQFLIVGCI